MVCPNELRIELYHNGSALPYGPDWRIAEDISHIGGCGYIVDPISSSSTYVNLGLTSSAQGGLTQLDVRRELFGEQAYAKITYGVTTTTILLPQRYYDAAIAEYNTTTEFDDVEPGSGKTVELNAGYKSQGLSVHTPGALSGGAGFYVGAPGGAATGTDYTPAGDGKYALTFRASETAVPGFYQGTASLELSCN
jgi:hypothetical protein